MPPYGVRCSLVNSIVPTFVSENFASLDKTTFILIPNDSPLPPRKRLSSSPWTKCGPAAALVDDSHQKELLSIILNTGNKRLGVKDLSINILNKYSLEDLKDISLEELLELDGIGISKELIDSIKDALVDFIIKNDNKVY